MAGHVGTLPTTLLFAKSEVKLRFILSTDQKYCRLLFKRVSSTVIYKYKIYRRL